MGSSYSCNTVQLYRQGEFLEPTLQLSYYSAVATVGLLRPPSPSLGPSASLPLLAPTREYIALRALPPDEPVSASTE